jgi:hypothetical protein
MTKPLYPALYQVNTRVRLTGLSRTLGRAATLDDIPSGLVGRTLRLKDVTGAASYDRDGGELDSRGLYLDLPPWGYHVFDVAIL